MKHLPILTFLVVLCVENVMLGKGPSGMQNCERDGSSDGSVCLQVLTVFCKRGCRKCCSNSDSCPPSKKFRFQKVNGQCKAPQKPLSDCVVDRKHNLNHDGSICAQVFTTFCKKGCKKCCMNKDACPPSNRYRFKKDGCQCIEQPKPLSDCNVNRTSPGLCPAVLTRFCTRGCKRCCVNQDGCAPSKRFSRPGKQCENGAPCNTNCLVNPCDIMKCSAGQMCRNFGCNDCSGECVDCQKPPNCIEPCTRAICLFGTICVTDYCNGCSHKCLPKAPVTECKSDGSADGMICGQAITEFCDGDCNCCKHKNTCNPYPSLYVKRPSDCEK